MDIKHLRYFIAIIESNYNLLEASKKIFVSQPALSQMINSFEKKENVILFERSHGRLKGLTPPGQLFHDHAKQVLEQYDNMMEQLQEASTQLKGKIKIGIPPFILSIIFSEVMIQLILNNPDIQIEIVELGAFELRKSLILKEVDIAILLKPTALDPKIIEEALLIEDELCAFMDQNHRLVSKDLLTWSDLHHAPIAICNKNFMAYHQLHRAFESHSITPNIIITSGNWDFTLMATVRTELIAFLPGVFSDYFSNNHVTKKSFDQPISWQVVMSRHKKQLYSRVEDYIFNEILTYFKEKA